MSILVSTSAINTDAEKHNSIEQNSTSVKLPENASITLVDSNNQADNESTQVCSTANVNSAQAANDSAAPPPTYISVKLTHIDSVETHMPDESLTLERYPRSHYVAKFKTNLVKNALSVLEMSRATYEASIVLDAYEFRNFCSEINLNETSSTIRKYIAIGRVYPKFIQYVDQLPSAWTTIYQITQIPADTFEKLIEQKYPLNELRGKALEKLTAKTRNVKNLSDVAKLNSITGEFIIGEIVTIRKFDDIDFRVIEKALSEISARLPIRFNLNREVHQQANVVRLNRYDTAKKQYADQHFDPSSYDFGEQANSVLPRTQDQDDASSDSK